MIETNDKFYIEVYQESGNHIRSMYQLRSTYLGLFIVGVAALVGLFEKTLTSPTFGAALAALGTKTHSALLIPASAAPSSI